jgi:hypothetical protein
MQIVAVALGVSLAFGGSQAVAAQSQTDPRPAEAVRDSEKIANELARCNGYWEWLADAAEQMGRPSGAELLKTYANGARVGALWILSTKYQVDNPNSPPLTLGAFANLVEGPAEIERIRLNALLEGNDQAALNAMGEYCRNLATAVDPILQLARKQILAPAP